MPKKDVTPDEYLALMNAELQKAPGYVAGMRFVYSPWGAPRRAQAALTLIRPVPTPRWAGTFRLSSTSFTTSWSS